MKKTLQYVFGIAVVIGLGIYIAFFNNNSSSGSLSDTTGSPVTNPLPNPDIGNINPNSGGISSSGGTGTTGGAGQTSGYKDGTFTGPVVDAIYGNIQVAAVISGGKLTNVNILQKPNSPGHTTEVSARSIPILIQEAIAAQSAHVNIVSGATQTSEGFIETLSSALSKAQA